MHRTFITPNSSRTPQTPMCPAPAPAIFTEVNLQHDFCFILMIGSSLSSG
jgi:hypothetical protein